MKRKSIITLLLSVLLIAVVLVGGTLAYLVAEGDLVINSFALADVRTDIDEPDGGNASTKTPCVINEGTSKVYVRARAVVVTGEDSSVPVTEDDLKINYNDDSYVKASKNDWEDKKEEYWVKNGDWYYYSVPLTTQNQKTEPLFDGVEVITAWENPQSVKFDIYVYHESVLASADENGPEAFN